MVRLTYNVFNGRLVISIKEMEFYTNPFLIICTCIPIAQIQFQLTSVHFDIHTYLRNKNVRHMYVNHFLLVRI